MVLDTGSANTWIGASKAYVITGTSEDTGEPVVGVDPNSAQSQLAYAHNAALRSLSHTARALSRVSHGPPFTVISFSHSFSAGTEYLDTVTLGVGLAITQQSIGVASSATGFGGVDGILG